MLMALAIHQPFKREFNLLSSAPDSPYFTRMSPYLRQSMPLPPICPSDPNVFVDQLACQLVALSRSNPIRWQYDPHSPLTDHWQSYPNGNSLLPYSRSLAMTQIAGIDRPFELLSGLDPPAGLWRSVAEGVSTLLT